MRSAAFFAILLLTAASAVAQKASEPTLDETIEWLKGHLKDSDGSPAATGSIETTRELLEAKDCRITIFKTVTVSDPLFTMRFTDLYFVPLGELSLSGFQVRPHGQGWILNVSTYEARETILDRSTTAVISKNSPSHEVSEKRVSKIEFGFADRDTSDRVAKAFAHAAKLCGAKPEPF